MVLAPASVNHSAPSGPVVMTRRLRWLEWKFGHDSGGRDAPDLGWGKASVNHRAPSGPAVILDERWAWGSRTRSQRRSA